MGLHVLVLAGGSGTRLWPLSRGATPKHLLPLAPGGQTLLRATLERVRGIGDSVHVVTAAAQADLCRPEIEAAGLDGEALIAEPVARGTGPALGLAVTQIVRSDPDALILSIHADHRVSDAGAYRAAVLASAGWAQATHGLATVGLTPTHAAAGLGYIDLGEQLDATGWRPPGGAPPEAAAAAAHLPAFRSNGFTEKPSHAVAEEYLRGGHHLWNLGLFAWPASLFIQELENADPEMAGALQRVVQARASGDQPAAAAAYAGLRTVPVEPLLLERGARLTVVKADFAWSDLGSWSDLYEARREEGGADPDGNVTDGDAVFVGSRNSAVVSRTGRTVAVAGMEGIVVVDTEDAVLVLPIDQAQRVREVVDRLRAEGREDRV